MKLAAAAAILPILVLSTIQVHVDHGFPGQAGNVPPHERTLRVPRAPAGPANPVIFEPNEGQTDHHVLFLARARNQIVYITHEETVLVTTVSPSAGQTGVRARHKGYSRLAFAGNVVGAQRERLPLTDALAHPLLGFPVTPSSASPTRTADDATHFIEVARFRLLGANSRARPVGQKQLPSISNYFSGNDPKKWRTKIANFQEVVTPHVYHGIDLIYHSSQGRLQYDFRVSPGADPSAIALEFPDAARLTIDEDGTLLTYSDHGPGLRHSAPVMYQHEGGQLQAVKGDWILKGPRQAGFTIASYDPGRELVIDPFVYGFSTYLGGTLSDSVNGMTVDAAGNAYVVGNSMSPTFPTIPGPGYTKGGPPAAVAAKLSPTGTLVFSAYIGGGGNGTYGVAIAVDAGGNVYLTGKTDDVPLGAGFPTTPGAFQTAFQGGAGGSNNGDAFVTKLNAAGTTLVYSTFLGGSQNEGGDAIMVDAAGNAYVGGWTNSRTGTPLPNFPIVGGFQPVSRGTTPNGFIAKVNPTGTNLVYSSFLGGTAPAAGPGTDQEIRSIFVDPAGNVYVTGHTKAPDFPTTAGALITAAAPPAAIAAIPPNNTGFVAKVNALGSTLLYCTYLGGSTRDDPAGIVVDSAGNAYVTGSTASNDFPKTIGAFQTTYQGGPFDAFLTKLNPTGSALAYSTYLGGTGDDQANGIAIDVSGQVYVAGLTGSPGFPLVNPSQAAYGGGARDAFVAQMNASGSALLFSTYLGGSGADSAGGIALDGSGSIYVGGDTQSMDFPMSTPYQLNNAGTQDFFVTRFTRVSGSSTSNGEGSYQGSGGPIGPEGSFGFGAGNRNGVPALLGPFWEDARAGRIFLNGHPPRHANLTVVNVSYLKNGNAGDPSQKSAIAVSIHGWGLAAAVVLVLGLLTPKLRAKTRVLRNPSALPNRPAGGPPTTTKGT